MASFETKVIAITGGASGMGLAVADYLVRRGARVSISDVQEKALNQAAATLEQVASLGASAVLAQIVDVRSVDQVDTWIKQTKRTFGQLDGAVNMAGVAGKAGKHPLVDQEEDDWEVCAGENIICSPKEDKIKFRIAEKL